MAKKDERPASVRAEHDRKISDWYCNQRKTQAWIAEQLGIDQATVSRTLKRLKKEAATKALKNMVVWQGDKLLLEQLVQAEALEAWFQSKQEKTITTFEYKDGEKVLVSHRTETRDPNPAYLGEITKSVLAEQKILGFDSRDGMILALPLEVIALAQEMGFDMKEMRDALEKQIRAAYENRHVSKGKR